MAKNNAFDELLAAVKSEDTRKALAEIADKEPIIRESVMMRGDYSRKLDEFSAKEKELSGKAEIAETWNKWRQEHYVDDYYGPGKGATKNEIQRTKELEAKIADLNQQIELGGEVDFNQLNEHVGKLLSERGYARQEDVTKLVDQKASGVEELLNKTMLGYAHITTKLPKLTVKHSRTYNEDLDGDELVTYATKNGFNDLEKAYESFTATKRDEVRQREIEARIEAARKEEREKVLAERGMNQNSMPTDDGGPEMGHFQRKMLGLDKPKEGEENLPELGKGGIAHLAAREI